MFMDGKKIFLIAFLAVAFTGNALAGVTLSSPNDGVHLNYGQEVTFEFSVSGSDGYIELYRDGTAVEAWNHCDAGCTQTYTSSYTPGSGAEGSHTWYVKYTGSTSGDDETTTQRTYYLEDDAYFADVSASNPADSATIYGDDVSFEYSVETAEPGFLRYYAETCSSSGTFNEQDIAGSQTISGSDTRSYEDCYGTFSWTPEYEGDDGSVKGLGFLRSFTIESDASQLTEFSNSNPNNGATFQGDLNQEATVDFDVGIGSPQDKGEVELYIDGSLSHTWTSFCSSCTTTLSTSETLSDGNYDWYAKFVGVDGSTSTTSTDSFEIEDYADGVSLTLTSPNDGESLNSQDVTFEYGGNGGGDGDIKLYVNGNLESTKSWAGSSSNSYSTTVNDLGGSHEWYVEYEGDDGSTRTSNTRTFTTPTDADQLTEFQNTNPSDGSSFVGTDTSITLEASIGGADGDVEFYVDGSQVATRTPGCTACTTSVSYTDTFSDGTHDWYAKFVGNDGSTTTTSTDSFTVNDDASQTSLSLDNPSQGETINDANGDVTFEVGKSGEDGQVELYIDASGTPANTWDLSCDACSESLSYTTSLSSGSHSYNARYIGSDGSSFTTSTKDFSVETSSDADDTTLSPDYPKDGQTYDQESVEYNYSVSGNSGSVEIYRNGSNIHTDSYDGSSSKTFSYSETLSNGAYEYYLQYVGDDGSTKSSNTRAFSVDAPLTSSISLDQPSDQQEFKNTFPIDVTYSFQVTGEAGSVELYREGSVVKTFTHVGGENLDYSYTESFSSEGNHTYYVKYIRDSDSQVVDSNTREFSVVQQEEVSLNIDSPSNDDLFEHDETIDFSYSASSNVVGDVELMINGSSVKTSDYLDTGNTVFYSYSTDSLSGSEYNSRVRFTSDDGNTHFSDYVNFSVKNKPVDYIDEVFVKYSETDSGSPDKRIIADLSGNSSIDDYQSVSGDTVSFSSDKWVIENISVPYQDDLVLYDTENRNDSRSLDFDVSVKNVAGHPENANLSYQEKNLTLDASSNAEGFTFNYSCSPDAYGDAVNVNSSKTVFSGSSESVACRWSGDWLNHSSGSFSPTVSSVDVDEDLAMSSWIEINNSEAVSFPSVKFPEVVPEPECSTEAVSVPNNSDLNKTANIDCEVGDSGSPTLTIDGADYKWNTTVELYHNLAENVTLTWDTNKSRLSDWESKDAGSSVAYFKGISDDILLAESSDEVEVRVPEGTFSGGVGEGLHPARIEYTVDGSSTSPGGGSSGGSDTPRIIRNVTGKYNWSVSAPRSSGQTFYNVVGWGGRDLGNAPTRIVVRNLGTGNFTLEARCVSEDNSCEFIELSENNITLDELENDRQVVQVQGVIPQDIPEDGYRFNIVFEDPEGQELETNFRINKNYAQSLIIRFISKVFGVEEIDFDGEGGGEPVPIPLALPVLLITGFFWGALSLFIRFAQSNNMLRDGMDFTRGRLIASMIVFILAFIFI